MDRLKRLRHILTAAGVLVPALAGEAHADHYKVTFSTARADDDGALRLARVEARLTPDKGRIRLTRTAEDSGLYHGWAGFLTRIEAEDRAGRKLPLTYEATGVWRVPPAARGEITVRYALNLQHDRFPNEPGDNELAYARPYGVMWTGRALFLEGAAANDVVVEFDLPSGWAVSAPWRRRSGGGWVFVPKDTDDLLDAAFMAGTHRQFTVDLGKAQALIALGPPVRQLGPTFERFIRGYFGAFTDLFGAAPDDNFLLIGAEASFLGGGVMGRTISLSLTEAAAGAEAQQLMAYIIAHEGFHLWNARWGDPSGPWPELEWLKEGAAEYYAFLTSLRLGVIDEATFLKFVSERYGVYLRALQTGGSLVSASATKNTSQHSYDLIYSGGMMALLLFDLGIRGATKGEKSLDGVVRAIHAQYADGKAALTLAELIRLIRRESGVDISTMVQRNIRGREPLELGHAFGIVGLAADIDSKDGRATVAVTRSASPSPEQETLYRGWVGGGAQPR